MLQFIKNLFRKSEPEWFYFQESKHYDISKMPDLSASSPIKNFSLTTRYKYCPETKELKFSYYGFEKNWIDYNKQRSQELMDFIDNCDKEYTRDKKLKKLLK